MVNRNDPKAGHLFKRLPKRLFPKKFASDYVKTDRVDANVAAAYNAQRTKTTTGSRGETEPNFNNGFLFDIPRTRSLSTYDPEKKVMIRSERGKVVDDIHDKIWKYEGKGILELYRIWQSDRRQGVAKFNSIRLKDGWQLFFSGNEYMWVIEGKGRRFISRIYVGRDQAYQAKYANFVSWSVVE